MRVLTKLFVISILATLHLSCQQREVYFRYVDIPNYQWGKNDTLYFDIDSSTIDTNLIYDISFELKHNVQYPYQNLWLSVVDNLTDSIERRSLQYMVADDFGAWKGAGFGSIYQMSLLYKEGFRFESSKNIRLKVVHKMRDESLTGIESLGLKIMKHE